MKNSPVILLFLSTIFLSQSALSQETYIPDLSKIPAGDGWAVTNLDAALLENDGEQYVHFTSLNDQAGIAWLDDYDFTNGTIEVDIKGKNARGQSFVGVAFRGVDMTTYDVVYFRPFNFQSPERSKFSVQYVSSPDYPWHRLRGEHPGEYENAITPPPDPDEFFHAKILIRKPQVTVYVNDNTEPSLVVSELSDRTGGKIGLWMDYISDGSFANLRITPVSEK